jgi:hypothetical protein
MHSLAQRGAERFEHYSARARLFVWFQKYQIFAADGGDWNTPLQPRDTKYTATSASRFGSHVTLWCAARK